MTAFAGVDTNVIAGAVLRSVEGLSQLAAGSVVAGLWQGAALAAGAAVCLRLVPRTTAAVRFAIWTTVFAVLALLPVVDAYVWRRAGEASAGGSAAAVHVDVRWSFAIALLWVAASAIRGVSLALGAVKLHKIWRRAVPVSSMCGALTSSAGLRGAQLCTSTDVDRPSVIGFLSPRILIPEEMFRELTATELEQIVLHEMGHLRRGDDWINLLQKVSLVLVPLNPVLLWIEKRLCFERELACDDDVLRSTNAPKAYATCLTNLAERRLGRRIASLSLGAWEKQSELARRVHRILRRGESMGRFQARALMGAMTLVLLGGATELMRCPQIISFTTQRGAMESTAPRSLPSARYQPVVFHPETQAARVGLGTAHETLLRDAVPAAHNMRQIGMRQIGHAARKDRHSAVGSALMRVRQRSTLKTSRGLVVLTSWSRDDVERDGEVEQPRIIFAVSGERVFSSSYAAVPTQAGWLVIQL